MHPLFQLGLLIFFCSSSQSNLSAMSEIDVESNWSKLQTDLLELIFKKLAYDDVVRIKAVCHSWNTYVQSCSLPRILLVMFPGNENHEPSTLGFFNLREKKLYHKVNKNIFCGAYKYSTCRMDSTQGWIVIFDKGTPKVYNPFSGDQILLPPLKIYPSNSISFRFIVSSDPSHNNKDFTVVAMHYNIRKGLTTFMFYKVAGDDNKWTKATTWNLYMDIICHNDKLFGLTTSRTLDLWDFSSVPNKKAPVVTKVGVIIFERYPLDLFIHDTDLYLVESLGQILIVRRTTEVHEKCYFKCSTIGFSVYKFDYSEENKWIQIHTLPPGRTILLNSGGSICVSIQDFPDLEENSIYYLDDDCLGIYNLKEKKFHRHKFENWDPKRRSCPPVLVIRPNT